MNGWLTLKHYYKTHAIVEVFYVKLILFLNDE